MTGRRSRHNALNLGLGLILLLVPALALAGETGLWGKQQEPGRAIAVVVDGSGSYQERQNDALAFAMTLLDTLAETKMRRWEPDIDQVSIISLDAMPQVLWQGSLREFKHADREAWVARFLARRDYAECTDVGAAFRLAVRALESDSEQIRKYLFAFTDLVDEPPTVSARKCRARTFPSLPPDDFPWSELQDVSVSIFWLPVDQKLAWSRVVGDRGLEESFVMYTVSESEQVEAVPPPRPRLEVTVEEQVARRKLMLDTASGWVGKSLLTLLIAIGAGLALLRVLALLVRRRRGSAAAGNTRRPIAAPTNSRRDPSRMRTRTIDRG